MATTRTRKNSNAGDDTSTPTLRRTGSPMLNRETTTSMTNRLHYINSFDGNSRCFAPVGRNMAWSSEGTGVVVRSMTTGAITGKVVSFDGYVSAILAIPDKSQVAVGYSTGMMRIFNTTGDKLFKECMKHQAMITKIVLLPNGTQVVTASIDWKMCAWDMKKWTPIRTLDGHNNGVKDMCTDENFLYSASDDTSVRIWSLAHLQGGASGTMEVAQLAGHTAGVQRVLICRAKPNWLWSASDDMSIRVWDITDRTCKTILSKLPAPVRGLLDLGTTILGCCGDGTMRSWFVSNAKPASAELQEAQGVIKDMSHVSTRLVRRVWTAHGDGVVRIWLDEEEYADEVTPEVNVDERVVASALSLVTLVNKSGDKQELDLIETLRQDLAHTKDLMFALEKELLTCRQENTELKTKSEESEKIVDQLKVETATAKEQAHIAQSDLTVETDKIQALQLQLQESMEDLQQLRNLNEKLRNELTETRNKQFDIDDLKKTISQLQTEIGAKSSDIQILTGKTNAYQANETLLQTKLKEHTDHTEHVIEELTSLKIAHHEASTELEKLKAQNEALQSEVESARKDLAIMPSLHEEVDRLARESSLTKGELEHWREIAQDPSNEKAKKDVEVLKYDLAAALKEIESLKAEVKKSSEESIKAKAEAESQILAAKQNSARDRDVIQGQLDSLKSRQVEDQQQVSSERDAANKLREEVAKLKEKNEELVNSSALERQTVAKLKDEVAALRDHSDTVSELAKMEKEECDRLKQEVIQIKTLREDIATLRQMNEELMTLATHERDESALLRQEIETIKANDSKIIAEKQQDVAKMQDEITALRDHNATVTELAKMEKDEAERLKQEVAEIKLLREEIAGLREKNTDLLHLATQERDASALLRQELEAIKDSGSKTIAEKQDDVIKLRAEISLLRDQNATVAEMARVAKDEGEKLKQELTQAKTVHQQELEGQNGDVAKLRAEIASLRSQNEHVNTLVEKEKNETAKLREAINLDPLRAEVVAITTKQEEVEGYLGGLKEDIASLRAQHVKVKSLAALVAKDNDFLKDEIATIKGTLVGNEKLQNVRKAIDDVKAEQDATLPRVVHSPSSKSPPSTTNHMYPDDLIEMCGMLSRELELAKSTSGQSEAEVRALRQDLATLREETARIVAEADDAHNHAEALETELAQVQNQAEAEKSEIASMHHEVERLILRQQQLEDMLLEPNRTLVTLKEEIHAFIPQHDDAQRLLELENTEVTRLKKAVAKARAPEHELQSVQHQEEEVAETPSVESLRSIVSKCKQVMERENEHKEKVTALTVANQSLKEELERAKELKARTPVVPEHQLQEQKQLNEDAQEKIRRLENQVNQYLSDNEHLCVQVGLLETSQSQLRTLSDEQQQDIVKLVTDLETMTTALQNMGDAITIMYFGLFGKVPEKTPISPDDLVVVENRPTYNEIVVQLEALKSTAASAHRLEELEALVREQKETLDVMHFALFDTTGSTKQATNVPPDTTELRALLTHRPTYMDLQIQVKAMAQALFGADKSDTPSTTAVASLMQRPTYPEVQSALQSARANYQTETTRLGEENALLRNEIKALQSQSTTDAVMIQQSKKENASLATDCSQLRGEISFLRESLQKGMASSVPALTASTLSVSALSNTEQLEHSIQVRELEEAVIRSQVLLEESRTRCLMQSMLISSTVEATRNAVAYERHKSAVMQTQLESMRSAIDEDMMTKRPIHHQVEVLTRLNREKNAMLRLQMEDTLEKHKLIQLQNTLIAEMRAMAKEHVQSLEEKDDIIGAYRAAQDSARTPHTPDAPRGTSTKQNTTSEESPQHDTLIRKIADLEKSLDVAKRLIDEKQKSLEIQKDIIEQRTGALADVEQEIEEYKDEVRAQSEQIDDLKDRIEAAHKELQVKQDQVDHANEKIAQLLELVEKYDEIHTKQEIPEAANAQARVQLERKVDILEKQVKDLQAECVALTAKAEEGAAAIRMNEALKQDKTAEIRKLQGEHEQALSSLSHRYEVIQKELDLARDEASAAKSERDTIQYELRVKRAELETEKQHVTYLQETVDKDVALAKMESDALRKALQQALQGEHETLINSIGKSEQQYKEQLEANTKLTMENTRLSQEVTTLRKTCLDLQALVVPPTTPMIPATELTNAITEHSKSMASALDQMKQKDSELLSTRQQLAKVEGELMVARLHSRSVPEGPAPPVTQQPQQQQQQQPNLSQDNIAAFQHAIQERDTLIQQMQAEITIYQELQNGSAQVSQLVHELQVRDQMLQEMLTNYEALKLEDDAKAGALKELDVKLKLMTEEVIRLRSEVEKREELIRAAMEAGGENTIMAIQREATIHRLKDDINSLAKEHDVSTQKIHDLTELLRNSDMALENTCEREGYLKMALQDREATITRLTTAQQQHQVVEVDAPVPTPAKRRSAAAAAVGVTTPPQIFETSLSAVQMSAPESIEQWEDIATVRVPSPHPDMNSKAAELEHDLQEAHKAMVEMRKQHESNSAKILAEIEEAKSDLAKATRANGEMTSELTALKADLKEARDKRETAERNLASLREQMLKANSTADLSTDYAALLQTNHEANERVATLEREVSLLKKKLLVASRENNEVREDCADLQRRLRTLKSKKVEEADGDDLYEEALHDKKVAKRALVALQDDYKELETASRKEIESLRKELEEVNTANVQNMQALMQMNEKQSASDHKHIAQLQSMAQDVMIVQQDLANSKQQLRSVQQDLEEAKKTNAAQSEELRVKVSDLTRVTQEKEKAVGQVQELKKKLSAATQAQNEVEDLKEKASSLEQLLNASSLDDGAKRHIEKLERQVQDLKNNYRAATQECDRLQSELEESGNLVTELQSILEALSTEKDKEIIALQNALHSTQETINEQMSLLDGASVVIQEKEDTIEKLTRHADALVAAKEDVQKLEEMCKKLEQEKHQAEQAHRRALSRKDDDLAVLSQQGKDLEQDLSDALNTVKTLKRKLANDNSYSETELDRAVEELQVAKQRCRKLEAELAEKNRKEKALQADRTEDVKDLQNRNAILENDLKAARDSLEKLKNRSGERNSTDQALATLQSQKKELEALNNKLEEDNSVLKYQAKAMSADLEDTQRMVKIMKQRSAAEGVIIDGELEDALNQLSQARKRVQELEYNLEQLHRKESKMIAREKELQQNHAQALSRCQELEAELVARGETTEKDNKKGMHTSPSRLSSQYEKLQEETTRLQQKVKLLTGDVEDAHRIIEFMKQRNAAEGKSVNDDFEKTLQQLSAARKRIQELESNLEQQQRKEVKLNAREKELQLQLAAVVASPPPTATTAPRSEQQQQPLTPHITATQQSPAAVAASSVLVAQLRSELDDAHNRIATLQKAGNDDARFAEYSSNLRKLELEKEKLRTQNIHLTTQMKLVSQQHQQALAAQRTLTLPTSKKTFEKTQHDDHGPLIVTAACTRCPGLELEIERLTLVLKEQAVTIDHQRQDRELLHEENHRLLRHELIMS